MRLGSRNYCRPLPTPDTAPVPALKNPDDGVAVEFPNPGAALAFDEWNLIGNTGAGDIDQRVRPLPRLMPILGRTIEMFGKLNVRVWRH